MSQNTSRRNVCDDERAGDPISVHAREPKRNRVFPPLLDEKSWGDYVSEFGMTPREAEAALLLTSGLGYAEICNRLEMSRPTLRTHLRSVYRKCDCGSRVELILFIVHRYTLK